MSRCDLENKQADYLLGGGDIIVRGSYDVKKDTLTVYTPNTNQTVLTLLLLDENTLVAADSHEKWTKR